MSNKEENWWDRNLRQQKEIQDKYKDATYMDLLKTVTFNHAQEYCHPNTEYLFAEFGIPYTYETDYEVKFLTIRQSDLVWTCTDTQVGLYFIFYINDDGSETAIGVMEQIARKSDKNYSFFSDDWIKIVQAKLIAMIDYGDSSPPIISLDTKVFND